MRTIERRAQPRTVEPADIWTRARRRAATGRRLVALSTIPAIATVLLMALLTPTLAWWAIFPPLEGLSVISRSLMAITAFMLGMSLMVIVAWMRAPSSPHEGGAMLEREDVPELFGAVDAICASRGVAPVDVIVITIDMNAFARDEEGADGRRILGLGAPLLMLLTPEQAIGVIAHEIGHFAHEDTASGRIVQRFLSAQYNARCLLEDAGLIAWLILPITLLLNGCSWTMMSAMAAASRRNEFAADAFAATIVGTKAVAESDAVLAALGDKAFDAALQPVRDGLENGIAMPTGLIATIPARMVAAYNADHAAERLDRARADRTGFFASHPVARERIAALGEAFEMPAIDLRRGAWAGFLGDARVRVEAELEAELRECLEADITFRAQDIETGFDLVETALAAIRTAPDPAEMADVAALVMERSLPHAVAAQMLERLCDEFPTTRMVDGTLEVTVPTARALVLAQRIMEDDVEALREAAQLAWHCPMMMSHVAGLMALLMTKPERLAEKLELTEDDAVFEQMASAVRAMEGIGDLVDIEAPDAKAGIATAPALPDWHGRMIVAEMQRFLGEDGNEAQLLELAAARFPRPIAGAPFFLLRLRVDGDAYIDLEALRERLCLPGGSCFELAQGEEAFPKAWRPLDALPGAIIFRADAADETPLAIAA